MLVTKPELILASTSMYRSELFKKMGLAFKMIGPTVDEDVLKNSLLLEEKSALQIAESLSYEKALSIFSKDTVVVAGDQLVLFNNKIIGKPYTKENAIQQLQKMNNQTHQLITAVAVITDLKVFQLNHVSELTFKKLSETEIKNYVDLDLPLDCAGSYKIEKSGICLFEKIKTDDFSAIQGLPMIWLSTTLKGLGYELFKK